jgi:hypothetical protein
MIMAENSAENGWATVAAWFYSLVLTVAQEAFWINLRPKNQ